jgi:hypothetical protein
LGRQFKRLAADGFSDRTAANALSANALGGVGAVILSDANFLQIGSELPSGDPRDFGPHAPQVFGFTTRFDRIANPRPLTTNFTCPRHDDSNYTLSKTKITPAKFRADRPRQG